MASIYHFTHGVLNRYRGRIAAQSPAEGAAPKGPLPSGAPASLRLSKRAPLAVVHCVNAQAAALSGADSGPPAAEVCDRLAALSLRHPSQRARSRVTARVALQLTPQDHPPMLDVTPVVDTRPPTPSPPSSRPQAAPARARTLRQSRMARPSILVTLAEAQGQASLAIMAQKLRLGLSRAQSAGSPEALYFALAQVERAAQADAHMTSETREQLLALLVYLRELADGSEAATAAEAFKHIETLCAERL